MFSDNLSPLNHAGGGVGTKPEHLISETYQRQPLMSGPLNDDSLLPGHSPGMSEPFYSAELCFDLSQTPHGIIRHAYFQRAGIRGHHVNVAVYRPSRKIRSISSRIALDWFGTSGFFARHAFQSALQKTVRHHPISPAVSRGVPEEFRHRFDVCVSLIFRLIHRDLAILLLTFNMVKLHIHTFTSQGQPP